MSETICPFCGDDYCDLNGVASDQYMYEGHIICECPDVPDEERDWINEPQVSDA